MPAFWHQFSSAILSAVTKILFDSFMLDKSAFSFLWKSSLTLPNFTSIIVISSSSNPANSSILGGHSFDSKPNFSSSTSFSASPFIKKKAFHLIRSISFSVISNSFSLKVPLLGIGMLFSEYSKFLCLGRSLSNRVQQNRVSSLLSNIY